MTDSDSQRPQAEPTARLAEYLQQYPQDLVDAHRLMHNFQVSAQDFAHVLDQLEQPARMSRLVQHLRQRPQDLVDACRLMRHYRISAQDFIHVLTQMEHAVPLDE